MSFWFDQYYTNVIKLIWFLRFSFEAFAVVGVPLYINILKIALRFAVSSWFWDCIRFRDAEKNHFRFPSNSKYKHVSICRNCLRYLFPGSKNHGVCVRKIPILGPWVGGHEIFPRVAKYRVLLDFRSLVYLAWVELCTEI